jgi:nicotinate dehydrogenase subunit B
MPDNLQNRREFLFTGAGLVLLFGLPDEAQPQGPPGMGGGAVDMNAFLKIGEDGRVTCFTGKVEMGQGAQTSLATVLAEELDVPFDRIDMVTGDTDLCPDNGGTYGSMTTSQTVPQLRRAGAEARAVLLAMAAEKLNVPAERLAVKAGVVNDTANAAASIPYAKLVEGRRIERHIPNSPVKTARQFQVIGKVLPRKDALGKLTGKAKYSGDILLPGMLYGAILRPPAKGAVLKSADTSAAEKVKGVRVLREADLIAVVHERPDVAAEALGLIKAEFAPAPPGPSDTTIFAEMVKAAGEPRKTGTGSIAEGEKAAAGVIEHAWLNSYVAHAPIETHTATAQMENGKLTVWASSQAPFTVRDTVARALQLPREKVRVVAGLLGGGFGGKSDNGAYAVEAARLAILAGKPVQVMYTRGEEFFTDAYRPAAVMKIRSGMTAAGKIAFWDSFIIGPGADSSKFFYDVPHYATAAAGGWMGAGGRSPAAQIHPFAVGPWRGPANNSNTFARESQIDAMAAKAGMDPVEFRLNNISDPRMRRVLEAAAKQFGYKPGKSPTGRGVGVSCGIYSNGYAANIAEVTVNRGTGKVQVKRVVTAVDVGVQINPEGLRQQCEGCVTMGLGYALTEEVRFRGGEILSRNFGDYELPRFSWLPKIETVLVDNPEMTAVGAGELSIVPMGGVIANAIFDAVGARLEQLPMTPARVKAALAKA